MKEYQNFLRLDIILFTIEGDNQVTMRKTFGQIICSFKDDLHTHTHTHTQAHTHQIEILTIMVENSNHS